MSLDPSASAPSSQSSSPPSLDDEENKSGSGCLTGIGIFVIVVCLILAGGIYGFRWYVMSKLPASEQAELRKFMSEPVTFPADWAVAVPYDPVLLAAEENVQVHGGIGFTWESDCQFYYRRHRQIAFALGPRAYWAERLVRSLERHNGAA